MFYVLEDKKRISIFINLLKSIQCNQSSNQSSLGILWSQKNGWLLMQNAESLNQLDNKQLVIISHFKSSFFTSCQADDRNNSISFEMNINNLLKVLKGVQKSVKKLTFQIDTDQEQQRGNFGGVMGNNLLLLTIFVHLDDGQLMIQRQIYQNNNIDQEHFFSEMQEMTQDKPKSIEISQEYFKLIKELKSEYIDLLFYKNHIMIKASSGEGPVLQINGSCLNMYDVDSLVEQDKNKLSVPPNYLIPQTHMAQKLGRYIEMSFQTGGAGAIGVYCRTQSDTMDIISFFPSQMSFESEVIQNPFSNNITVNQTENINNNPNMNVNQSVQQQQPQQDNDNLNPSRPIHSNNNNINQQAQYVPNNNQFSNSSMNNTESEYEIPQNKFQRPQMNQNQQNQQQQQSEDEIMQRQFRNNIRLNAQNAPTNKRVIAQYNTSQQSGTDMENEQMDQINNSSMVTNSNRIIDINESHQYLSKKSTQKDNLLNLNNQQQRLNINNNSSVQQAGSKRQHPDSGETNPGMKKQQLNLFNQNQNSSIHNHQQQQQQQQSNLIRGSGASSGQNLNRNGNSTLNLTTSNIQRKSGSTYSHNILNANISSINQVDSSNMNASIFNNHVNNSTENHQQHFQVPVKQHHQQQQSNPHNQSHMMNSTLRQQQNRATSNNLITFMNQNRPSNSGNGNDNSIFVNKNKGIQIATQNSSVSGSSNQKSSHNIFQFGNSKK